MADYTEIKGNRIQYLDSDPTLTSATEGQVWYNTTTGTLRGLVNLPGATSSSAPMISPKVNGMGFGTQTAAVSAGSQGVNPSTDALEYNGSGWTSATSFSTQRNVGGAGGTQTAGLLFGGQIGPPASPAGGPSVKVNVTEEYDGSVWTTGGNLNTARYCSQNGAGTQTAALYTGGLQGSVGAESNSTETEEYNGTSWTEVNDLPTANRDFFLTGPQTAAVGAGGYNPSGTTTTVEYDGSTWTTGGNLPEASATNAGNGTQTAALVGGGVQPAPSINSNINQYDGTSWTTVTTLSSGRRQLSDSKSGTTGATVFFGGNTGPGATSLTEEYNSSFNVITAGAWSSGGALPDSKRDGFVGSIGTQTAGLAFGGEPVNAETYEYNGSTWAVGGDLGTGRRFAAGFGTQSAAGATGGNASVGFSAVSSYETYDGSSWSEQPDLNTARASAAGAGTITSAVVFGGSKPAAGSEVEEYDGSSWTSVTSLPAVRTYHTGAGTQTAALATGGVASTGSPYGIYSSSLEYDGSSWTTGGNLNTGRAFLGSAGTQTAYMAIGGDTNINPHSTQTLSEQYNGTSFSTLPSLAVAGQNFRGTGGTTSAAYEAGGFGPGGSNVATTEEFTGETSVATASTLTTS